MPRAAGSAAAARADRTHATTWMSPRSARLRNRMAPTPLLAPVIARFTIAGAPREWLASTGRAQLKGAPPRGPLRIGRRDRIVGAAAVDLQLLHPRRPRLIEYGRVRHPGEDHRVDAAVEAQAPSIVVVHVPAPELALAAAAAEKELAVRRRHAIEVDRVRHHQGINLNLAERDVVDEAPVGHRR